MSNTFCATSTYGQFENIIILGCKQGYIEKKDIDTKKIIPYLIRGRLWVTTMKVLFSPFAI